MYDANVILQSLVTKTTTFTSTGVDLKVGTPRRGLKARLLATSYSSVGTAGTVFTPTIEHSDDNTTYVALATGDKITGATAAAAAAPIFIPIETSKRYVRLVVTLSPSSGTPSITYLADLGLARP